MISGSYRRDEAADPEIYAMRLAIEFQKYPAHIAEGVALALPEKIKWLPSIAEVHEALEAAMLPEYREAKRQADAARRQALLAAPARQPEATRSEFIAAQKANYGPGWGIHGDEQFRTDLQREADREAGLSPEQRKAEAETWLAKCKADLAAAPTVMLSPGLAAKMGLAPKQERAA